MNSVLIYIDKYSTASYRWTTNKLHFFKDKIFSFQIPMPFKNINRWFLIKIKPTQFINENKLMAYYKASLETYSYKGYGNDYFSKEHYNENGRSLETNTYIYEQFQRKVVELETLQENLIKEQLVFIPSNEIKDLLEEYNAIILLYKNFYLVKLKGYMNEKKEISFAKSRNENLNEVIDKKLENMKTFYNHQIENLKFDYENQLLTLKQQQHQADEERLSEITSFRDKAIALENTNQKLQNIIDEQLLQIKGLQNNSKYIELQNQKKEVESKATKLFMEKQATSILNTQLTKENMELKSSTKFKELEIKTLQNNYEKQKKDNEVLLKQAETTLADAHKKHQDQLDQIITLNITLKESSKNLEIKEQQILSLKADLERQETLSNISNYRKAEKSMLITIKKIEEVIKISRETLAETTYEIILQSQFLEKKMKIETSLLKENTELTQCNVELSNYETYGTLMKKTAELQPNSEHALNNLHKDQLELKNKQATLIKKISDLDVELQKITLQLEFQNQIIRDKAKNITSNFTDVSEKIAEVKLNMYKTLNVDKALKPKIEKNNVVDEFSQKQSRDKNEQDSKHMPKNNHSNFDSKNFMQTSSIVRSYTAGIPHNLARTATISNPQRLTQQLQGSDTPTITNTTTTNNDSTNSDIL